MQQLVAKEPFGSNPGFWSAVSSPVIVNSKTCKNLLCKNIGCCVNLKFVLGHHLKLQFWSESRFQTASPKIHKMQQIYAFFMKNNHN